MFKLLNTIRGPKRTGEELLFAVSKTGKESSQEDGLASPRKSLPIKRPDEEGFVAVESDDVLTHWGFDG